MGYIANILTDAENDINLDESVNVCVSPDMSIRSLPTLIIGYRKAKGMIDGFNILEKSYPSQNLYWTFTRHERRHEYETDIGKFYDMAVRMAIGDVTYRYVNPYQSRYNEIKQLLSFIKSGMRKTVMYDKNGGNMFIYDADRHVIYGVSLNACEFIGIDSSKVIWKIVTNPSNRLILPDVRLPYRVKKVIYGRIYCILPIYERLNGID